MEPITLQNSRHSGLIASVLVLLRMRLILIVGGFRRATWRGRAGYLLLVVLILVGMGFAFYLIWQLLKLIRSPEINLLLGDLGPITAALPGFVVTAAFVGLFLTSFGFLLQALYLAGDMDFLLSSPVPIRAVFLAKLCTSFRVAGLVRLGICRCVPVAVLSFSPAGVGSRGIRCSRSS